MSACPSVKEKFSFFFFFLGLIEESDVRKCWQISALAVREMEQSSQALSYEQLMGFFAEEEMEGEEEG